MGGAGAGAGLALAHQANQMGRVAPPQYQAPPDAQATGTAGAPPSAAILGAELSDKQQLSLRKVKDTAHLPLVAVDLFSKEKCVAYYPPKPSNPEEGTLPIPAGKLQAVAFQPTEESHKTLRKFLNQSKTYEQLEQDSLATGKKLKGGVIEVASPELYLGLRRSEDAEDLDSTAISQETSTDTGVTVVNSTLDGSPSKNDDFDRVVLKVRLLSSKKSITMLPEEAVQISLHSAQRQVSTIKDELKEEMEDFPLSVAVPSWMMNDPAMEALHDATNNAGVFFPRSVCALSAILLPDPLKGGSNPVHGRIVEVLREREKEHLRKQSEDSKAKIETEVMFVMIGRTTEGLECTAIQVYSPQKTLCCPFGDFKVISNVFKKTKDDPVKELIPCLRELRSCIDDIAPEASVPIMLSAFGSSDEVQEITQELTNLPFWKKVPVHAGEPDDVAKGAAVLGAVSHGRVCVLVPKSVNEGKSKADLAIRVQHAAPVAIGMRINYFDDDSKWEEIKPIFDFDRRVPAGPHTVEFKASECILHREGKSDLSGEAFLKAVKANESAKFIPDREKAARCLKIEIYQRIGREEAWEKLGDTIRPLVEDDPRKEGGSIAFESVSLHISLGVTGLVSTMKEGDR